MFLQGNEVAGWNHKQRVLEHLKRCGSLTRAEANKAYSVGNLPDIVWKLKRDGYKFEETWETGKNQFGQPYRVKRYSLAPDIRLFDQKEIDMIDAFERAMMK